MITVKENTTLVGISELRTNFNKVMEAVGKHKVLLERRNKPLAVIVPVEKYNQMEELVGLIEDISLGYLAKERDEKSESSDYIDLEEAGKKVEKRKS
ncbi:MAG: type II toxin-antitoxin system Phd/YefM family antitoxin [Candidatus Omnitrophica bacterium]|nr:type II toxin-antitoxin system Phd/YefM family antitoxin [Candidatus Omnitrophota bacterium]